MSFRDHVSRIAAQSVAIMQINNSRCRVSSSGIFSWLCGVKFAMNKSKNQRDAARHIDITTVSDFKHNY